MFPPRVQKASRNRGFWRLINVINRCRDTPWRVPTIKYKFNRYRIGIGIITCMRNRKSIRLKNYNYSSKGFYFVTICTKDRKCFFGQIENNILQLSDIGELAKIFWNEIPQHFPNTELGEFVIMPNHIHGIIQINFDP